MGAASKSPPPRQGLTAAVRPRAPAPEVAPLHGAEIGRLVVVTAEVVVVPPAAKVAAWGGGEKKRGKQGQCGEGKGTQGGSMGSLEVPCGWGEGLMGSPEASRVF